MQFRVENDGDRLYLICKTIKDTSILMNKILNLLTESNFINFNIILDGEEIILFIDKCPFEVYQKLGIEKKTISGVTPLVIEEKSIPQKRIANDTFTFKGGEYKDLGFSGIVINFGYDKLPYLYKSFVDFKNEENKIAMKRDIKSFFENNQEEFNEIKNVAIPYEMFRDFFLDLYDKEKVLECISEHSFCSDFFDLGDFEELSNIEKIIEKIKLSK